MLKFLFLIVTVFAAQEFRLNAQVITIPLTELSYTDNVSAGVRSFRDSQSLSPITGQYFSIQPSVFPKGLTGYKYLSVYSSEGDGFIDVLVKPDRLGDSLLIDLNNDNDLRNDGGPFFFPANQYEFVYGLTFPGEYERNSYRSLLRYPSYTLTDSLIFKVFWEENFDSLGNLNEERTIYWQRHDPNFKGKKGTFYYLGRKNLKKGMLKFGALKILIGLQDRNVNGLFNDEGDLKDRGNRGDRLYIDLDGDKKLSSRNTSEFFSLTDTIQIYDKAFIIKSVDPLGNWIRLESIPFSGLDRFITHSLPKPDQTPNNVFFGKLNPELWNKSFQTIEGNTFNFSTQRNFKILINFWGEWCQPCYKEMPLLAELNKTNSKEISIVSFLLTSNLEKAKEVIQKEEMNWPHILVDDSISSWFNVSGYPANFFIPSPDDPVVQTIGLDTDFIKTYILD